MPSLIKSRIITANKRKKINMKTAYITVSLQLKDGADIEEVIQELEWDISHPDLLDAEIIASEIFDEED